MALYKPRMSVFTEPLELTEDLALACGYHQQYVV